MVISKVIIQSPYYRNYIFDYLLIVLCDILTCKMKMWSLEIHYLTIFKMSLRINQLYMHSLKPIKTQSLYSRRKPMIMHDNAILKQFHVSVILPQ